MPPWAPRGASPGEKARSLAGVGPACQSAFHRWKRQAVILEASVDKKGQRAPPINTRGKGRGASPFPQHRSHPSAVAIDPARPTDHPTNPNPKAHPPRPSQAATTEEGERGGGGSRDGDGRPDGRRRAVGRRRDAAGAGGGRRRGAAGRHHHVCASLRQEVLLHLRGRPAAPTGLLFPSLPPPQPRGQALALRAPPPPGPGRAPQPPPGRLPRHGPPGGRRRGGERRQDPALRRPRGVPRRTPRRPAPPPRHRPPRGRRASGLLLPLPRRHHSRVDRGQGVSARRRRRVQLTHPRGPRRPLRRRGRPLLPRRGSPPPGAPVRVLATLGRRRGGAPRGVPGQARG